MQVNNKAGLTFASGPRSILRQDPDVIMLGEIRDQETAGTAVQAALTGHLVFSTLHTNDAPGTVVRLGDMGVAPYLISSSLLGVIAQRLVRKICAQCKENYDPPESILKGMNLLDKQPEGGFVKRKGCKRCHGTGLSGRLGLYELLELNQDLARLISSDVSGRALANAVVKSDMRRMVDDGLAKVFTGQTTVEEVLKIVGTIDESANYDQPSSRARIR